MHELHSSLCWAGDSQKPQRLIEEPNALQSSILAAFGHKVADGKLVPLDDTGAGVSKKRGRPKGSKNKAKAEPIPPKRRGRPPKHLLRKANPENEL
jgi:hypothetical protein